MAKGTQPVEQRKVELVPHNPDWPMLAREEADLIQASLPEEILAVHHIGSTSIPGIKAKPILDFVVVVKDLDTLDQKVSHLTVLGYESKGERGIEGRRFFSKDSGGSRSHHLHAFQKDHPEIKRHLRFRDYLRTHPEAAQQYQELKERLAERYPNRSGSYTEAKSDFILSMDDQARRWYTQEQKA